MRRLSLNAAALLLLGAFAAGSACSAGEEEPEPQIKITDWEMDRARKDISGGTNLVRAIMRIKNTGKERIKSFQARLVFMAGMGGRLGATPYFRIPEIKPGEAKPLIVQSLFVPIFGAYELHVDYRYGAERLSHRYQGASPFSPPNLVTKELLPKTAKVVVLGHDIQHDPRSRMAVIAVRLKNLGEMEARDAKVHFKFYDKNRKLIGRELSRAVTRGQGDPNPGVVKGGEEFIMRFALRGVPKFTQFDMRSSNSEPSAEERFSGGDFPGKEEVEVAHLRFKRPAPVNLSVSAKVRNGLKTAIENTVITFIFYAEKEVTLRDERRREYKEKRQVPIKKIPIEVSGQMKPGDVKDVSFDVTGVAHFVNFGYEAAYKEPEQETKRPMSAREVGEVVVEDVSCVKKGEVVHIIAKLTNRRKLAARDIKITFEFKRTTAEGEEVTARTVEHLIKGLTRPGESKDIAITVEDPPPFTSYFFNVSYSEGGPAK